MLLKVKLKHNLKAKKFKISDLQNVMKLIRYRIPRRAAQIFWRTIKQLNLEFVPYPLDKFLIYAPFSKIALVIFDSPYSKQLSVYHYKTKFSFGKVYFCSYLF